MQQVIYDSVDPEANIIFGAMVDPAMMSEVSITVLATGFSLGIDLESKPKAATRQVRTDREAEGEADGEADGEAPARIEAPLRAPVSTVPSFRTPKKKKTGGIFGSVRRAIARLFGN